MSRLIFLWEGPHSVASPRISLWSPFYHIFHYHNILSALESAGSTQHFFMFFYRGGFGNTPRILACIIEAVRVLYLYWPALTGYYQLFYRNRHFRSTHFLDRHWLGRECCRRSLPASHLVDPWNCFPMDPRPSLLIYYLILFISISHRFVDLYWFHFV